MLALCLKLNPMMIATVMMMRKVKMIDVQISKHYDYFMGERRPFWRADYLGETIATLCRTKAECLKEAREWIGKQNKR